MFTNIYDILSKKNNRYDDKIAIKDNQKEYTYFEMKTQIDKIAASLLEMGIKKGDRVAIYLPNSFSFIVTFFACSKNGIICVPLNWINNQLNVRYILKDSGCTALISYDSKIKEVIPDITSIDNLFENIYILMLEFRAKEKYVAQSTISEDTNLLLYTSGSTGQAKGVILTHFNTYVGGKIVGEYLEMSEQDIVLALLPFSFDYGLNQVISTFLVSGTLVIKYPYLIYEIPQIIEKERITGMAGIPTIWINLLNQRNINNFNFDSLRYITNSGEAIPERYLGALEKVFTKTSIYLMYGLTECFRCTYLEPKMFRIKKGSIGKAIPGCEIIVVNDEGKRCQANEIGELYFRGQTVAKGYWGIEKDSVFIDNPFNGCYKEKIVRSGDLVYEDEEGYLFFIGRNDKMIKKYGYRTNGFQIANEILNNCDYVKACCVIGIRETEGQRIVAFIELCEGESNEIREKDILLYSKKEMPMFMRIDTVITMETIPKLNSNKYDISKLEHIAAEYLRTLKNK